MEDEDGGATCALAPFLGPAAELVLGSAGERSDPAAWLAATLPGLAATVREYLLAELVDDAAAVARVLARLPAAGSGPDDVPPALHVLELAAPRGGEAAARGAELLYSSRRHGRSLSRLVAKCDGYAGDLVVLLETLEAEAEAEGALLAACRGGLEGGSVAALLEAGPSVAASVDGGGGVVLRTRRRRARGSSHEELGVGFGGSAAAPTWWVDEDFKAVSCRSFPRPGVTRRKVAAVSAWGLGGAAAAAAQAATKERERRFLEQRRQVDLKKLAQEWKGGGGDAWLLQAAGQGGGGAAGEVVRGVRQEERQLRQEQQQAG